MILSDFSIKRPLVVVVVTIALMLFGYFALTKLKTNQFPDVQPPVLVVNVPYPGASPETVEREILNRIEDSMSTIQGIRDIRSYARDSSATIVVVFEFDKDLTAAAQELRDSISTVRDKLPGLRFPGVALTDYADRYIVERFSVVDGVARLHPGSTQHIGQAPNPLVEVAVGVAQLVGVDDFLVGLVAHTRQQQALDQQRCIVGIVSGSNQTGLQHGDTYCWFFQWAQSRALAAGSNQPKE